MTNAIIMASGLGTRMRPLTYSTPKPLLKVNNTTLIETVIKALRKTDVSNICVVTGYLSEQFEFLTKKYSNVTLLYNPFFKEVNNISSVYTAKDVLLNGDCYICEADLYIADENVLCEKPKGSCYYGIYVSGHSDDWVFDTDENGIITRVGKCGNNLYNMTGISFFFSEDCKRLYRHICETYATDNYESLFWDDVVNKYINEYRLTVKPVKSGQITEIDTVSELEELRKITG